MLNLIITSPYNGALLFQSPILVEGTIKNAASGIASVTCNGNPATVEGDTFSCEVPLAQGANVIIVSAIDNEGNSASSNIEVILEDIDQLIQAYGPIVYFHGYEIYFPDDVEAVLDNCSLKWGLVENEDKYYDFYMTSENSTPTSSEQLINDVNSLLADPISQDSRFRYYLEVPDNAIYGDLDRAKAYVRVRPWGSSYTDVEFHMYYPFNGPGRTEIVTPYGLFGGQLEEAGRHYSDWEVVVLRFSNNPVKLEWVGLSGHGDMKWYTPGELDSEEGHPVVFSAMYSHALYNQWGRHKYECVSSVSLLYEAWNFDLTSDGTMWRAHDNYKVVSSAVPGHDVTEPSWLNFGGRWGQYSGNKDDIKIWLGIVVYRYREVGAGPFGPYRDKRREWWTPSVIISPDPAYFDTDLTTTITGWYPDPGDSYQWQKWNGTLWQDIVGATENALESSNFAKNDWIKVICYPDDETNTIGAVEDTIIISNSVPIADANGPYSGTEGYPIDLDASGSYDPDGEIVLYEWDLDNDDEYDDALGENVTATFGDNGTFTVKLKVTDEDGGTDEDETTVLVANLAPTVDAGSDQNSQSGDLVSINATFTDPGFLDTHTASVDWGDGETGSLWVTETNGSGFATGTHTYIPLALYTVSVTITDDDGASTTDTLIVNVTRKTVSIDIKPGSDTNPVNLKSNGVIPVAILADKYFDVSRVKVGTVHFGPAEASPICHTMKDVNGDGDTDIILHFRTQEVGLEKQDTEAILTGQTIDGMEFIGNDTIRNVPANDKPNLPDKDDAPGQDKEPGDNAEGKGKDSAPGQDKEPGDSAIGKGNDDAPGQNKEPGDSAIGKGNDDAPGQNKEPGDSAIGKGKDSAPGQDKEPGDNADGEAKGKDDAPG